MRRLSIFLVLMLLCAERVHASPDPAHRNLTTVSVRQADCAGPDCSVFEASWPAFPEDPQLAAWIESSLMDFFTGPEFAGACGDRKFDIQAVANDFFRNASRARHGCKVHAVLELETPRLVVLHLRAKDSSRPGPAAHWTTRFLNYDRQRRRLLTLNDLLLPDQHAAFFAALAKSAENQAGEMRGKVFEPGATPDCPWAPTVGFRCLPAATEHFKLTGDGIMVVYRELGGDPAMLREHGMGLSFAGLQGIVRPEWAQDH